MQTEFAKDYNPSTESLATRLWGIQWEKYFPLLLCNSDEFVIPTSYDVVAAFLKENYKKIYTQEQNNNSFIAENYSQAKERYYRSNGDFFIYIAEQKPVGVFTGTVMDWSSYYIRNCSIISTHQGKKYYQKLLIHLLAILKKHNVERAEVDVAPSNLANVHTLNKLAFNINGIILSERWGTLLHFTKYLSPIHENVFLQQFCHGVKPQSQKHTTTDQ